MFLVMLKERELHLWQIKYSTICKLEKRRLIQTEKRYSYIRFSSEVYIINGAIKWRQIKEIN